MMKKIIISRANNIAAIVQQNKIQEFIIINKTYQVNDIYLGKIQKIFTGINAAFINLNKHAKSGFIHVNDIKKCNRQSHPINNITESITVNQILLVQILKEPTQNKGPRLTTNIHLAGQYLILMPFNNTICIANNIYDENERSYLRAIGTLIKPTMMGLLFKESSNGIKDERLIEDLRTLKKQWSFILKTAIYQKSPSLIYKDGDIIKKIIRDFHGKHTAKIILDSKEGLKKLNFYLQKNKQINVFNIPNIQLYTKQECILNKFSIKQTIHQSLKTKIELVTGAYIFIESYEALTIIDVNSGSFNKSNNMKETILKTNCLAASEIAYQLKIRNINGVIIVDFIDMTNYKDQLKLLEHFNKVLKTDHARPTIIQLSELGLVELTRRRREKSLFEIFNNEVQVKLSNNILLQSKHEIQTKNIAKNLRINSIFFQKEFNKNLTIELKNCKSTSYKYPIFNTIKLFPLQSSVIIPIYLYYSMIEKIIE
uniref:Ribonuclease E n=1 Tax=Kumanoa americana TaxID=1196377 RepID=A0A1C9CGR2_9FLOR|nr:ribonuclease E [Kumanoa americana]AOM67559.1 ribonuclease E [Kumanoa americana]